MPTFKDQQTNQSTRDRRWFSTFCDQHAVVCVDPPSVDVQAVQVVPDKQLETISLPTPDHASVVNSPSPAKNFLGKDGSHRSSQQFG